MTKELSNLSGLHRTHGMMYLTCPICFINFGRYASQIADVSNPTCSYACAGKAREVRVFTPCMVCGVEMEQTPSEAARVVTCGTRCSRIRKSLGNITPIKPKGTKAYKDRVKAIQSISKCANCETTLGPWAIRGLEFDYSGEEPAMVSDGYLWCRACHLKDVAPLGTPAREQRKADKEL
jgi:hypothetical protein